MIALIIFTVFMTRDAKSFQPVKADADRLIGQAVRSI